MAAHREAHQHCVVAMVRIGEVAQLVGAAKAVLLLRAVVLHLPAMSKLLVCRCNGVDIPRSSGPSV